MKCVVVFAHYDIDEIVDDYVIFYLKALKKAGCDIVFVSCGKLSKKEQRKLDGIVIHTIAKPHKEYDFGSYKRGYFYLKDNSLLENYDELIYANDSCFGPFHPLEEVFKTMENRDCDFWGISENWFGFTKRPAFFLKTLRHIQSYFIAFKKNVFMAECFDKFMSGITEEFSKHNIIAHYEIGLSQMLYENGFKSSVYIEGYKHINNVAILRWRRILLKDKMPFFKCSLPRLRNKNTTTVEGYPAIIKEVSDYPVSLIMNNVLRTRSEDPEYITSPLWFKRLFYDTLGLLPFCIRKSLEITIKHFFPIIRD